MLKSFAKRLLSALMSLVGAGLLIWAIMPLAPGDPALRILQQRGIPEPTEVEISEIRLELGLDKPLITRFALWAGDAIRGDLGFSWQTGEPVGHEIARRMPATLILALTAFMIAAFAAIPAGLLAARWHGTWLDGLLRLAALFGAASPSFIVALIFIHLIIIGLGQGQVVLDGTWRQAWLPASVLAIDMISVWSRLLRAGLLGSLGQPYITCARARGASRNRIILFHAFPNASIPLLNAMGISFGSLLGGTVIVETIFTWPGLGRYVIEAISARDLPVVQAYALLSTICYVGVSLLVDVGSSLLDPRIMKRWG